MFDKDRIVYQLERTRVLSLGMIDRIPHERWFEMPSGITHVGWNVGHLAIAEYFLGLVFTRGMRESDCELVPENYADLFGYGSVPRSDSSLYPTPSEILEVLAEVHERLLKEVRDMPNERLNEPCQFLEGEFDHHPIFEKIGGALEWLGYHEHVHIGTIGLLRRELGAAPVQYFQESRAGKKFV